MLDWLNSKQEHNRWIPNMLLCTKRALTMLMGRIIIHKQAGSFGSASGIAIWIQQLQNQSRNKVPVHNAVGGPDRIKT